MEVKEQAQSKSQMTEKGDQENPKKKVEEMDGDMAPKEAIIRAEFLYDKLMDKVSRVR